MNVDDESESECPVSLCSDFESDFGQTMELLEIDIEEIQVNVEHSLEEVICNIKMSIEIHVTQVLNKSMLLISLIPQSLL